ncbi:hypothetical protein [Methylorubrum aminovorans]
MTDPARLNSLLESVADATAPERSLFAEVFFTCAGKQHPDIKADFAVRMDEQAWRGCPDPDGVCSARLASSNEQRSRAG